MEKNVGTETLFYKSNQNKYDFKKFRTIRTLGEHIYNGKITLEEADKDQSDSVEKINDFTKTTRPRSDNKKQEKEISKKPCTIFMMVEKCFLIHLKVKYF